MKLDSEKRKFLQLALFGALSLSLRNAFGAVTSNTVHQPLQDFVVSNASADPGNFKAVFQNPQLKSDFFLFLKNVFNLYPEQDFQALIEKAVKEKSTDQEVYVYILQNISEIKPFLSELSHALPALFKQKEEMTKQTLEILKGKDRIDGYLEIGSTGRYLSSLRKKIRIDGTVALLHDLAPTYSPVDLAERGGLFKLGQYIPLNNYAPVVTGAASFEVIGNYIGLHHCPMEKLDAFIQSLHQALKSNGILVLRDHDVATPEMNHMVSLAHDVFNAGLTAPWALNHQEVRHFRSLDAWIEILKERGFKHRGHQILQDGDPTKNTLMEFVKV